MKNVQKARPVGEVAARFKPLPKAPGIAAMTTALALLMGAMPVKASQDQRAPEEFPLSREPQPQDWHSFIKSPEAAREQLWVYQVARGKKLGDWAWGWRLGWVRVCATSERPFCGDILRQALFDKALVVRAEAATRLGRLYENSHNAAMTKLLAKAFGSERNVRHGRPLFVQERILFALKRIGGDEAQEAGSRLASSHAALAAYWQKLAP